MSLRGYLYPLLLVALVLLQGAFWQHTHTKLPDMTIVPTPPGKPALDVLSFGDSEFLFRSMAFVMGNAGDTFGRTTPLYKYDMAKVQQWFTLLDNYNAASNLLPSLAAYYYSQTQNRRDVRYMVTYLKDHALRDVSSKWWWLVQATYLAMHRVDDTALALEVSTPLAHAKGVPVAMQQLPAIVHEKRGEFGDALFIMEGLLNSTQDIPEQELRYMNYFIEERIQKLDELGAKAKSRLKSTPIPRNQEK